MKTPLLLLLPLLLSLSTSAQTILLFTNQTMIGSTNDTTLNVKADNNPVIWQGIYYFLPVNGTNIASTNGNGSFRLVPGSYHAAFAGIPKSFPFTVTNSATPINLAALATNITIYSGVQSITGAGGITVIGPTGAGGHVTVSNNVDTNAFVRTSDNRDLVFGGEVDLDGTPRMSSIPNAVLTTDGGGFFIGIGPASTFTSLMSGYPYDASGAAALVGLQATNKIVATSNGLFSALGTKTNFVAWGSANSQANITFSNFTPSVQGGLATSMLIDFQHVGKTNLAGLMWSSNAADGAYGAFYMNSIHGGTPVDGDTTKGEFEWLSSGHMSLIPGLYTPAHIQIGSVGASQNCWAYMTMRGAPTANQVSGSYPFAVRCNYNSNDVVTWDKYPNIRAAFVNTNRNSIAWEMQISGDVDGGDNWTTNLMTPSAHFGWGTNGGGAYFDYMRFEGMVRGVVTNRINIETNDIEISGTMTAVQPSDTWNAPSVFTAGTSSALTVSGQNTLVAINSSAQQFQVQDGSGSGATAHAIFLTGPAVGGSYFRTGGLGIGTNNIPNVGSLDVWGATWTSGGIGSGGTNKTLTVSSTGITNTLTVNYNVYMFTGTSVVLSNTVTLLNSALGTITTPINFTLQPNDVLRGTSCASLTNRSW